MSIAELAIGTYGAIQKSKELEVMLDIIATEQPHTIVEIGTKEGGTLFAICQVAPDDALIISIDTSWETYALASQLDNDNEFYAEYCKPTQNLRFLHADTHDDSTLQYLKNYLAGEPIDFLFIDGDHTYKGVKRDWVMYSPLVADGGMVAFHDIATHTDREVSCKVDEFWVELKQTEPITTEIYHDPRSDDEAASNPDGFPLSYYDEVWGGIGIVYISRGGE
jgi:predicted O-methyltransferase YrrM